MLPQIINIGSRSVNTVLLISMLGAICWAFILWSEAKKDGFNTTRFFDLIFISSFVSFVFSYAMFKLLSWLKIYRPSNLLLSLDEESLLGTIIFVTALFPMVYFAKKFRWSVFRVLDIYSMACCVLLMFYSIGKSLVFGGSEYVLLLVLLSILYITIMRHRGYRFTSGTVFSIFLLFMALSIATYFRRSGYTFFGSILVMISMINLYLRSKKNMSKISFPKQFMAGLKAKLISKEKKLNEEQKALIRDDPYLQQGRASDNAETMDDVLEDTGKTITDARMGIVRNMKTQIRKALAAIKLGRYGRCEICGRPIDMARLKAYPEATTCIDCATDASQRDDIREDKMLEENL